MISAGLAIAGLAVAGPAGAAGAPRPRPAAAAGSARHHDRGRQPGPVHRRHPGHRHRARRPAAHDPALAAAEDGRGHLFAQAVSTPGSPQFHHYLSPDAYAARFAATPADARAVESWLRPQGFTAVSADPQRSYVQATATAATINRAFDVQLKLYKPSAPRSTRAATPCGPTTAPSRCQPRWPPRARGNRTGQRRADRPEHPASNNDHQSTTASAQGRRVLGVLRAAPAGRPAEALRPDVLPHPDLRLLRQAAARRLRRQPDQHRQGRDDRPRRAGPARPGPADHAAGLRQGQRPARAVGKRFAERAGGQGLHRDGRRRAAQPPPGRPRRRGADGRRGGLRDGAGRERDRGGRRCLRRQ